MIDHHQSIFGWYTSLTKRAKTLIPQNILLSGPHVYPHTSLVMKHYQFPYNMPIIIKSRRFLITTNIEEITIWDQGIISFSGSLAYIDSVLFPLKASYWNRYRILGAQDSCVFKRPDFYQALIKAQQRLFHSALFWSWNRDSEEEPRRTSIWEPSIVTNPFFINLWFISKYGKESWVVPNNHYWLYPNAN